MPKSTLPLEWTISEETEQPLPPLVAITSAAPSVHRLEMALAALLGLGLPLLIALWLWPRPIPSASHPFTAASRSSSAPLQQPITATVALQNPIHLGPIQTLEIANFTIRYPAADAEAVYAAVPRLEQLLATLRHDLGEPTAGAPNTIPYTTTYTIEVAATLQSFYNANLLQRRITVTSPTRLAATELTPAALLYQESVYPLARLLQSEWVARHDASWQATFAGWYPLQNSWLLWELWHAGGPLAAGHDELVQWLATNGGIVQPIPPAAGALCDAYRIWQIQPAQLGIPLTCPYTATAPWPAQPTVRLDPLWRAATAYPTHKGSQATPAGFLTGASVLEYIAATYGRDKTPELLEAMGEYTTVDTLIPALFGLSSARFEAAWQASLPKQSE